MSIWLALAASFIACFLLVWVIDYLIHTPAVGLLVVSGVLLIIALFSWLG